MRKLAYFASEGTVSSGEDEATASDLFTIILPKILTTLLIAAFYTLFLLMIDRNLFSRGQQYICMQSSRATLYTNTAGCKIRLLLNLVRDVTTALRMIVREQVNFVRKMSRHIIFQSQRRSRGRKIIQNNLTALMFSTVGMNMMISILRALH